MTPEQAVFSYVTQQSGSRRYCVAFSGGMDSHALLLLMTQLRDQDRSLTLRALHIDHGLRLQPVVDMQSP